ncbi:MULTISPECIES: response regulator transcription factor [Actinomadura]|uniref:Response regulator n=1 Tax=Actinomadura litoris TaxID=2678616 RepID=A0A7K1L1X6_9ACTN|nr:MULTISPECIES: response regulator transcription factor [Actinomadura]MBT2208995.1 response regulator transcription factor [Actinomadura sp. NEAU-AAG7]MUN38440.1 response regulator [Actinomadura litoris]
MNQPAQRVLVVDDEPYLADLVATALRYEGYTAEVAGTCAETAAKVTEFRPDLIVLDVMLPDGSGLDACHRLRREGCAAPVVFLTARDATEDKIAGLTVGGDDYVTKPFSLEELIARIRAVLRRTSSAEPAEARLSFADLVIDEEAYEVRRKGESLDLTPTEFKLLRYLVINAGRVLTKRQILDHVWNYDHGGNDGVVQTYVSYLRRKVDAIDPPLIHTIPRVGYVLRLPKDH